MKLSEWLWMALVSAMLISAQLETAASQTVSKKISWQSAPYHNLMWDRIDSGRYNDSIAVALFSGFTEKPDAFNLVIVRPYQFFYAERQADSLIQNCVFQEGIYFEGEKNSQWPTSLTREILLDSTNIEDLPLNLQILLKATVNWMENRDNLRENQ